MRKIPEGKGRPASGPPPLSAGGRKSGEDSPREGGCGGSMRCSRSAGPPRGQHPPFIGGFQRGRGRGGRRHCTRGQSGGGGVGGRRGGTATPANFAHAHTVECGGAVAAPHQGGAKQTKGQGGEYGRDHIGLAPRRPPLAIEVGGGVRGLSPFRGSSPSLSGGEKEQGRIASAAAAPTAARLWRPEGGRPAAGGCRALPPPPTHTTATGCLAPPATSPTPYPGRRCTPHGLGEGGGAGGVDGTHRAPQDIPLAHGRESGKVANVCI